MRSSGTRDRLPGGRTWPKRRLARSFSAEPRLVTTRRPESSDRAVAVTADQLAGGDLHSHRRQPAGDLAQVVDHHLPDLGEGGRDTTGSVPREDQVLQRSERRVAPASARSARRRRRPGTGRQPAARTARRSPPRLPGSPRSAAHRASTGPARHPRAGAHSVRSRWRARTRTGCGSAHPTRNRGSALAPAARCPAATGRGRGWSGRSPVAAATRLGRGCRTRSAPCRRRAAGLRPRFPRRHSVRCRSGTPDPPG